MTAQLNELMGKLREVQSEIEVELAKRREELRFHLDANYAQALFVGARLDLTRRDIERSRTRISRFNQIASPTVESLWLALRIERLRGDKGAESSFASQLRRRFPGSKEFQAYERGQFE